MAQSIRDQMLNKGLVSKEDTFEAKRAAARAALPVDTEKALPPPFEAPARGVIVASKHRSPAAKRTCAECGTILPASQDSEQRYCAECQAEGA
jgi:hypothetical protein